MTSESHEPQDEAAPDQGETTDVAGKTYDVAELTPYAEQLPVEEVPTESLLDAVGPDHKYWVDTKGEPFGPHEILKDWDAALVNPRWREHVETISRADLNDPIWIHRGTGLVFNGVHRLTRAIHDGQQTIKVRFFKEMPDIAGA